MTAAGFHALDDLDLGAGRCRQGEVPSWDRMMTDREHVMEACGSDLVSL
jgi:hypothetical protein